jgi:hypothetical protein
LLAINKVLKPVLLELGLVVAAKDPDPDVRKAVNLAVSRISLVHNKTQ